MDTGKFYNITHIIEELTTLAHKVFPIFASQVRDIIENGITDGNKIDHLLDDILEFCFDDSILRLYKKLCQYYFKIDEQATIEHISSYREMWDEDSLPDRKDLDF